MKVKIRKGVFETNSSSEHSLSIVKKSNYDQWKNGTLYARRSPNITEYNETWGNFWSEQYYWSFDMITKEDADRKNIELFNKYIDEHIEEVNKYVKKHKDSNDIEVIRKWAEGETARYKAMTYEVFRPVDKLYNSMWITYAEYQESLHQDDCYSPFEHVNETEDVVVFGKYYHS